MNKCIHSGRLTKAPEIRYSESQMCIARFTLAINRNFAKEGQQQADFLQFVAFGKVGEFVEKYLKQGTKVIITSQAQSGSYTKTDGTKVYYTEFVASEIEFAESKSAEGKNTENESAEGSGNNRPTASSDGFMSIPDGIEDELPFR